MISYKVLDEIQNYLNENNASEPSAVRINGNNTVYGYNAKTDFGIPSFLTSSSTAFSNTIDRDKYVLEIPDFMTESESLPSDFECSENDADDSAQDRYYFSVTVLNESFSEMLLRLIDERGITDSDCYKLAGITRQHFNKIKNEPGYKVKRTTALALCFALKLPKREFMQLLSKAGFTLSNGSRFDLIVKYCLDHNIYDLNDINIILNSFEEPILGSKL